MSCERDLVCFRMTYVYKHLVGGQGVTAGHKTDIFIIVILALDPVLQVWVQYNGDVVYLYLCPYL